MRLTDRRKDFLDRLVDIYNRTAKPVHYETVAKAVGVSKWTAYDMLKELERTGFLTREYSIGHAGAGRSQVVYVPTEDAYGISGQARIESAIEESVNRAKQRVLDRITEPDASKMMDAMMQDIQHAENQVEYCVYVLGVFVFVLHITEENALHLIKHLVLQAPPGSMQLAAFTGVVFGSGLTTVHSEVSTQVVDLIGEFLKQVHNLAPESQQVVASFLVDVLSAI